MILLFDAKRLSERVYMTFIFLGIRTRFDRNT